MGENSHIIDKTEILFKMTLNTHNLNLLLCKWSSNNSYLPLMSGDGTYICLSNLPGLNNAGSKISTLLVAAKTTTPDCVLKPINSTENNMLSFLQDIIVWHYCTRGYFRNGFIFAISVKTINSWK